MMHLRLLLVLGALLASTQSYHLHHGHHSRVMPEKLSNSISGKTKMRLLEAIIDLGLLDELSGMMMPKRSSIARYVRTPTNTLPIKVFRPGRASFSAWGGK